MAKYYDPGDNAWYYPDVTERESDEESFDLHYGDEISGNAEQLSFDDLGPLM